MDVSKREVSVRLRELALSAVEREHESLLRCEWVTKWKSKRSKNPRVLVVTEYTLFVIKKGILGASVGNVYPLLAMRRCVFSPVGDFMTIVTDSRKLRFEGVSVETMLTVASAYVRLTIGWPEDARCTFEQRQPVPGFAEATATAQAHALEEPGWGLIATFLGASAERDWAAYSPPLYAYLVSACRKPTHTLVLSSVPELTRGMSLLPLLLALATNGWCQRLVVRDVPRPDAVVALSGVFHNNTVIQDLVLSCVGAKHGYAELGDAFRANPRVSLTRIDLSGNPMRSKGLLALAEGLHGLGHLRALNIADCGISGKTLVHFFEAIYPDTEWRDDNKRRRKKKSSSRGSEGDASASHGGDADEGDGKGNATANGKGKGKGKGKRRKKKKGVKRKQKKTSANYDILGTGYTADKAQDPDPAAAAALTSRPASPPREQTRQTHSASLAAHVQRTGGSPRRRTSTRRQTHTTIAVPGLAAAPGRRLAAQQTLSPREPGATRGMTNLEYLNLSGNRLGKEGTRALSRWVRTHAVHLRTLVANECQLNTLLIADVLPKTVHASDKLRSLFCGALSVPERAALHFSTSLRFSPLSTLSLSGVDCSMITLCHVAKAFLGHTLAEAPPRSFLLRNADWSKDASGINDLEDSFGDSEVLVKVVLDDTLMPLPVLETMISALATCPNLAQVSLCRVCTATSDPERNELARCIVRLATTAPVRNLWLTGSSRRALGQGVGVMLDGLAASTTLSALCIAGNQGGDATAHGVRALLEGAPALTALNVAGAMCSLAALQDMVAAVCAAAPRLAVFPSPEPDFAAQRKRSQCRTIVDDLQGQLRGCPGLVSKPVSFVEGAKHWTPAQQADAGITATGSLVSHVSTAFLEVNRALTALHERHSQDQPAPGGPSLPPSSDGSSSSGTSSSSSSSSYASYASSSSSSASSSTSSSDPSSSPTPGVLQVPAKGAAGKQKKRRRSSNNSKRQTVILSEFRIQDYDTDRED